MPSSPEWFRTACRWGQLNLREHEVPLVNVEEWADFWVRCRLDGVTIHAGGSCAVYPTRLPLHKRAPGVDRRDVFGELVTAAKARGLRVLARFDPSVASPEVFFARPDWFFVGADGQPRRDANGLYHTCINASYYWEFIPQLFTEIVERYAVDGFVGDHWQGYGGAHGVEPSFSAASKEKYRLQKSADLPRTVDLSDPNYRQWLQWRHDCLKDVWLHWEDTVKLFRRDMTWIGVPNLDSLASQADVGAAESPAAGTPLWRAGEDGRLMRTLSEGSEKRYFQMIDVAVEDSPASRSPEELSLLLAEATASGSVPCIRFESAVPFDRRPFAALERFYAWHSEHDTDLFEGRDSAACVAVLVSEQTQRFHGDAADGDSEHLRGIMAALTRAGIPFDLIHEGQIQLQKLRRYRTVVLANVACLSADACDILWEFGSDGGGLVVTFETSICDEWGVSREDYGMTERLGVKLMRPAPVELGPGSFFRVSADHELLKGFGETQVLPGGGRFLAVELLMDHKTPLQIAPFALSPAAAANCERSQAPAVVLGPSGKGRVVYFPTEPDRLFWTQRRADHADLIAAAVRWANKEPFPVELNGPKWVGVQAYRKGGDLLIHLTNLNAPGAWEGRADSLSPLPSLSLTVRAGGPYLRAELLVTGKSATFETDDQGFTVVTVPETGPHEIVALRAGSG